MADSLRLFIIAFFCLSSLSINALKPSYYADASRLAEGKWVKVQINHSGVHEISYDQLRSWGFHNPEKVRIYGYGGSLAARPTFSTEFPDDLPATCALHTDDRRILFYAEGDHSESLDYQNYKAEISRNLYDLHSFYFLTEDTSADAPSQLAFDAEITDIARPFTIDLIEREVQNVFQGGAIFHGPKLKVGDTEAFDFEIRDFDATMGTNGILRYSAAVCSETSGLKIALPTIENFTISSKTAATFPRLGSGTSYNYAIGNGKANFAPNVAADDEGVRQMKVNMTIPKATNLSYAAFDRMYVIYPRKFVVRDSSPEITGHFKPSASAQRFLISGNTENAVAWDITDITDIKTFATGLTETGTLAATLPASPDRSRKVLVFDTAAHYPTPEFAGEVDNCNIHGMTAPDYLIITTEALREKAEALAEIHRSLQGLDVHVLTQNDIFNEFSSGARSPYALRRCVKMFYERSAGKLRHVLLYGPAYFDNRGITADNSKNLVCYEIESESYARDAASNPAADLFFGMIDDDFAPENLYRSHVSVNVGRIPASNFAQAEAANAKSRNYLLNPPSALQSLGAIMISDNRDSHSHVDQSEDAINALREFNPNISIHRVDPLIFPLVNNEWVDARNMIASLLKRGQGLFVFCGHARSYDIGGYATWNILSTNSTNYTTPPFALLATCSTYPMDQQSDCLATAMLFKTDGGSVATVAACRSVYKGENQYLSHAIAENYAKITPGTSTGDIYSRAVNDIFSSSGITSARGYNTLCYNFCGDPALPLTVADHSVEISEINGSTPAEALIPACEPVSFKARILNPKGEPAATFNGMALIEIYDSPRYFKTDKDMADDTEERTLPSDSYLLAKFPVKVENGIINATITVPAPAAGDAVGRIVIGVDHESENLHAGAALYNVNIKSPTDQALENLDKTAPEITDIYLNDPGFTSGDHVGAEFVFHADINPSPSGLELGNTGIRNGVVLSLDSKTTYFGAAGHVSFNSDGTARFTQKFGELQNGHHTLTLTVANNAGQTCSRTIDFNVVASSLAPRLEIDNGDEPVREAVTFAATELPEGSRTRLVVRDAEGGTVLSVPDCSFPYLWDLQSDNGTRVPDGKYNAFVICENAWAYGSSNSASFIVLE